MVHLDPDKISLADNIQSGTKLAYLLQKNILLLQNNAKHSVGKLVESGGAEMLVRCMGIRETDNIKLTLNTDESYKLIVTQVDETVSMLVIS